MESPFHGITAMEGLCVKVGRDGKRTGIWIFSSVMDLVRCGACTPAELNASALVGSSAKKGNKKGFVELIAFKDSCRKYLLGSWLGSLDIAEDVKGNLRKVFNNICFIYCFRQVFDNHFVFYCLIVEGVRQP